MPHTTDGNPGIEYRRRCKGAGRPCKSNGKGDMLGREAGKEATPMARKGIPGMLPNPDPIPTNQDTACLRNTGSETLAQGGRTYKNEKSIVAVALWPGVPTRPGLAVSFGKPNATLRCVARRHSYLRFSRSLSLSLSLSRLCFSLSLFLRPNTRNPYCSISRSRH